eukprot:jgi/Mesvir1/24749/Mv26009-RA.1
MAEFQTSASPPPAHGEQTAPTTISQLLADAETTATPVQTWLDCLGLEARAVGLEISVKIEAMVIGASSTPPLPRLLDGTEVSFRDRFKLLGSWLPDTRADDVDIRIGLAWARLRSLNTYWRSKGLGEHRKRMLFKVLVLTVLTYGAEAWTLTPTLAAKLDGRVYMQDAPTGPECRVFQAPVIRVFVSGYASYFGRD